MDLFIRYNTHGCKAGSILHMISTSTRYIRAILDTSGLARLTFPSTRGCSSLSHIFKKVFSNGHGLSSRAAKRGFIMNVYLPVRFRGLFPLLPHSCSFPPVTFSFHFFSPTNLSLGPTISISSSPSSPIKESSLPLS
jgi:hypothetical protein